MISGFPTPIRRIPEPSFEHHWRSLEARVCARKWAAPVEFVAADEVIFDRTGKHEMDERDR